MVVEEMEYFIYFKTNINNPISCSISNSLMFKTSIALDVFTINHLKITIDTVDIATG